PENNWPFLQRWGCDSPQGTYVQELQPDGKKTKAFPCLTIPTLGDLLTSHGISWKYYAPAQDQPGYEWSVYNAIKDIRDTSQWQAHVVDYSQFATDAASGNLPTVSWLVQPTDVSDHPGTSICRGENWTVQQINAVMGNSPLWDSTAIFLTWDDFGGFYDHVKPAQGPNGLLEYGFRAPMIVISPYAKPHFIDNTSYTQSSMLKFAETVLKLPSLGGQDTHANDMFNSFNFSQQPLPPLILKQRTCPAGSNNVLPFLDQS
ncbi:MAG: alkaline phosphatase family protein, partial [Ktedonobacteraceae bacterium]